MRLYGLSLGSSDINHVPHHYILSLLFQSHWSLIVLYVSIHHSVTILDTSITHTMTHKCSSSMVL
jgi:hypothetical protein